MAKQSKKVPKVIVSDEIIAGKIYLIREQKVMFDKDLAELYGVETRRLNEQVRRNIKRFPKDFMFQLTKKEFDDLKSQIATSSWGGRRKLPLAFTEQGVAMLSSVLNSDRAIEVNIQIMRIFTKMREMLLTHKDLMLKIERMEKELTNTKTDVQKVFEVLKQLIQQESKPRREIGFKPKK